MQLTREGSIEVRAVPSSADLDADAASRRLDKRIAEKIRLENVCLTYPSSNGGTQVLKDVNLAIHEGEIVTLIGPSGSGKSTILNVISDTARAMGAQVEGEVHVSWNSRAKGRLGYVLQKDALLPWRTLLGNVELGLEIQGRSKTERQALARDWIARVGLDGFEDAYPHQLSGGMRQRATIVRTLICKPEIVLMDEPFGALDAQTRIVLQQLLIDMWAEQRPTICFVTHDLDESILLGHRVVMLGARPGTVRAVQDIDIPHPREVLEVKAAERFQEIYKALWDDLKHHIPSHLLTRKAA